MGNIAQVFLIFILTATNAYAKSVLLLIDVQKCFIQQQGGSLGLDAEHIISNIEVIRKKKSCLFDAVALSQDYHPAEHISFSSTHGLPFDISKPGLPITCLKPSSGLARDAACCPTQLIDASKVDCNTHRCPPNGFSWDADWIKNNPACQTCKTTPAQCFDKDRNGNVLTQMLWPKHCKTDGDSEYAAGLTVDNSDIKVQKGTEKYVDAYSAFMDNSQSLKTPLDKAFGDHGIDTLWVAGIATDVCVKWTVRDALGPLTRSYKVNVISDANAGTTTANHDKALKDMEAMGAKLYTTAEMLEMKCETLVSHGNAVGIGGVILWIMAFATVLSV